MNNYQGCGSGSGRIRNYLQLRIRIQVKFYFQLTNNKLEKCRGLKKISFFAMFRLSAVYMNFSSTIQQGSIFRSENDIYSPPPSENFIFSPSFFDSHRGLFALILPYFAFIFPFFFLFSNFFPLSSFFFPLSSLFFHIFRLFLLVFSYFFPQMTSADISPPPGGGYFPLYRPLQTSL
jgi:hypothetical protein